ncbi:type II and III secretion system protein family protein [Magnetospirillum sp. SS-4]|uniref:type II and III secretion system protein family protein n=1 Tax=Magnetospirillum sp. SS-4 TaxID=2681465 RepID=UPI00137FE70E|nr:type II and III secretion system protein family protein [Magnetospirillum sp. SS-4]CAA7616839.1 Flp pilus assembly protein, secretin CpaC [Magnetospirillum sp. SS-4]
MTFRLFRAVLMSLLLLTGPALARDAAQPPPPDPAPRGKVVTMGGNGTAAAPSRALPASLRGPMPAVFESIRLAVGKSADILLPTEVRDVIVGNSDIADVMVRSPTQIYMVGRAPGQTNVFLIDRSGKAFRRYEVDVAIDSQAVREVLRQVLPDESAIQVSAVGDSLYLSGTVRTDAAGNAAKALARRFVAKDENLVNMMRISNDQQVLLQVKVVEMQRTVVKELGVGVSTTRPIGLAGHQDLTGFTTSTIGQITTSYFGSATVTGIGTLTTNLSMLENQGLIRTLVEPNLTAVSGETATMLAGGEIPIPVADVNGSISVEFKPYGVLMNFTPTVLDPGRLSLKMTAEVSAIDTANRTAVSSTISVPAFKVRRAGSTVELPSGGSIMIAGLLQNDLTGNVSGLPGLMDIPVLGALFRSNAFQRNETELVVILSAYVVQSVDRPDALATPSDGFAPASDIKRFLFGRLQDTYTKRGGSVPPVPGQLQGPFGYIVQ